MNSEILAGLSEQQREIAQHKDGPALVIAGAGSGKTRVIVHRVACLIDSGVEPSNIMMLTFTNKAAHEMAERIAQQLQSPQLANQIQHGTFHSMGSRFLRRYAPLLGYEHNFTILDSSDAVDLVKASMGELKKEAQQRLPKASLLQSIFSLAFNRSCDTELIQTTNYADRHFNLEELISEEYPNFERETEQILEIHKVYRVKKRRNQAMSFDDLLENWLELLLKHRPQLSSIKNLQYTLVDEFQDTNKVQSDLVHELSKPNHNIMVVGDDAQSIYSWRGANFKNILNFPDAYQAKTYRLEQNYRSTPDILSLANACIEQNMDQFKKELYTQHPNLEKPRLYEVYDQEREADMILEEIDALRDQDISLSRMVILYRNHIQSSILQVRLTQAGIPFSIFSGIRFFEQAHIKDLLSFLKVLFNPLDEIAWMRILKMIPGIGNATAQKIFKVFVEQKAVRLSPDNEALQKNIPSKARERWESLLVCFQSMLRENASVDQMIQVVYQGFYQDYMKLEFENVPQRQGDISHLCEFAANYDTLEKLLNELSLIGSSVIKDYDQDEENEDKISLTTIHQAKGLEWDVVFLVGLTENQFPHQRSLFPNEKLEEERRLFYVAVTRAKRHLILTAPLIHMGYGGQVLSSGRSRFIQEVPEGLFESHKPDQYRESYAYSGSSMGFSF